jgi:hypothetical protein
VKCGEARVSSVWKQIVQENTTFEAGKFGENEEPAAAFSLPLTFIMSSSRAVEKNNFVVNEGNCVF